MGNDPSEISEVPPLPPTKNASVASKGVVAKKCAIRALILCSWSAIRAVAERTLGKGVGNKIEGGGVPYPGYFAKCAEALEFKRVGGNSCFQV